MRAQIFAVYALVAVAITAAALVAAHRARLDQSAGWPRTPRGRPVAPLFDAGRADELLEGPARDRWQKPAELVKRLQLRPGATVADIGSGTGYLLPHLSRAVGSAGAVYAQEIQETFLPRLRQRAKVLGNVEVVLGTSEDPRLPVRNVDCFVLLTVYHEVERPVEYLKTLRSYAAPNARLAIIDFDTHRKGEPPVPRGHEVSEQDVLVEARNAGWDLERREDLFQTQFFLVFSLAEDDPAAPQ
jgi:SAM-dependent methyltransferase